MNKIQQIEKDYCEKLQQAKIEDNHNKIMSLLVELNILRKFYRKKKKLSSCFQ